MTHAGVHSQGGTRKRGELIKRQEGENRATETFTKCSEEEKETPVRFGNLWDFRRVSSRTPICPFLNDCVKKEGVLFFYLWISQVFTIKSCSSINADHECVCLCVCVCKRETVCVCVLIQCGLIWPEGDRDARLLLVLLRLQRKIADDVSESLRLTRSSRDAIVYTINNEHHVTVQGVNKCKVVMWWCCPEMRCLAECWHEKQKQANKKSAM